MRHPLHGLRSTPLRTRSDWAVNWRTQWRRTQWHVPATAVAARQVLSAAIFALVTCSASLVHAAELLAPFASSPSAQAAQSGPAVGPFATVDSTEAVAEQRAAERQQIDARRRSLDATYLREQAACLHRFFVNDCLDHARRAHRVQAQVLDDQSNAIDLAGRQQRAEAERQRVAENLRNRPAPIASAAQKQAAREQQQAIKQHQQAARVASEAANQAAYASKQAAQEQAQAQAQAQAQSKGKVLMPKSAAPAASGASAQTAQQAAAAQAAYAQKQAEYQRRKAQAAQQLEQAKKAGSGPAPALPIPPGY
jgi:hypothetical protein